jgi:hypothetical protein
LIGAGGTGLVLLFRSADGPSDAVRNYLSDVRDAHYGAAYARLCGSVRGVRLHRQTGVPTTREVQVDLQRATASVGRVTYQVGKENGKYCILTTDALFSRTFPDDPGASPSDPFGDLPGGGGGAGGRGGAGGGGSDGGGSGSANDGPPVRTA